MKKFFVFLFVMAVVALMPNVVFAVISTVPTDPVSVPDFLMQLWLSVGQVKGASALCVVLIITQAGMYFFRTELGQVAGKWKLSIVLLLSLASGVIALKLSGLTWVGALLHSTTLTAMQVFGHQVIKQFSEKPALPAQPPSG
jgi:hypothetical protein